MRRAIAIAGLVGFGCSSPYSPINMTELPEASTRLEGSAAHYQPTAAPSVSAAPSASASAAPPAHAVPLPSTSAGAPEP